MGTRYLHPMANQYRTITPKGIESIFHSLATTDPRIHSFRMGDFAKSETAEDGYPLLMFELEGSKVVEKGNLHYTEWNVRLYSFTMRRSDWANVTDAFSECHVILSDLVLRFRKEQSFKDWGFTFDKGAKVSFDYVIRDDRDDLVGVSADLQFYTPLMLCLDDIPGDALPDMGLFYSGSPSISSNLTCATISGCTVIQSIQQDIETLFASSGATSFSIIPGDNIVTGGTASAPIVNVTDTPSFTSVSATTYYSGGSLLQTVVQNMIDASGGGGGGTVDYRLGYSALSTTAYTVALSDAYCLLSLSDATPITVTLDSGSTLPVGSQVLFKQEGAGQLRFSAGTGVTLTSYGSAYNTVGQYSTCFLTSQGGDFYVLDGNLTTINL